MDDSMYFKGDIYFIVYARKITPAMQVSPQMALASSKKPPIV